MLKPLIAAVALLATTIQAWSAAVKPGGVKRDAIDCWDVDDELVAEVARFGRRRAHRRS